jgi:hypothetical protein
MKLVRPDVFHPRIVLAGSPQQVSGVGDDAGLIAALRRRGLQARWSSWDDPEVGRADLVILRSVRDYAGRLDEFLAWTTRVANLLNAPAVVAWNVNWTYLGDLALRGVPTVSGEIFAPGDPVRLPRSAHVFVSPAIGTGSSTDRLERSRAAAYVAELHRNGHSVFVQPSASAKEAEETVLVFLGGRPSHAFTGASNGSVATEPDFEVWDVGSAALAAAAAQVRIPTSELLYARAHVVGDPPRLQELQLVDPSLGWRRLDSGARDLAEREFAVCVESALERLGLGPLSHRRP